MKRKDQSTNGGTIFWDYKMDTITLYKGVSWFRDCVTLPQSVGMWFSARLIFYDNYESQNENTAIDLCMYITACIGECGSAGVMSVRGQQWELYYFVFKFLIIHFNYFFFHINDIHTVFICWKYHFYADDFKIGDSDRAVEQINHDTSSISLWVKHRLLY